MKIWFKERKNHRGIWNLYPCSWEGALVLLAYTALAVAGLPLLFARLELIKILPVPGVIALYLLALLVLSLCYGFVCKKKSK